MCEECKVFGHTVNQCRNKAMGTKKDQPQPLKGVPNGSAVVNGSSVLYTDNGSNGGNGSTKRGNTPKGIINAGQEQVTDKEGAPKIATNIDSSGDYITVGRRNKLKRAVKTTTDKTCCGS
ncbi:hypothetical protein R6Q59_028867 [Mikania micrantha]